MWVPDLFVAGGQDLVQWKENARRAAASSVSGFILGFNSGAAADGSGDAFGGVRPRRVKSTRDVFALSCGVGQAPTDSVTVDAVHRKKDERSTATFSAKLGLC